MVGVSGDPKDILPIMDPLEFLDVKKDEARKIDIDNMKGKLMPIAEDADVAQQREIDEL